MSLATFEFGKHFWTPGFGPGVAWLGALLAGIAFACALRSVVWWKASGPASESELTLLRGQNIARRLCLTLLSAVGLVFPLLFGLGVLLTIFQPSPRSALLLISQVGDGSGLADWSTAADRAAERDVRLLDVGRASSRALQLVVAKQPGEFTTGDDTLRQACRAAVVQVVEEFFRGELELAVDGPKSVQAAPPIEGVPAWLVESIELACLRLLSERLNVGSIVVQAGGRKDENAVDTWSDAETYLTGAERLLGNPQVDVFFPRRRGFAALVSVDPVEEGTKRRLVLGFSTPAASGGGTEEVVVRLHQAIPFKLPLGPAEGFFQRIVELPGAAPFPTTVKWENRTHRAYESAVVRGGVDPWSPRVVRVLGPPEWRETVELFQTPGKPAAVPWFAEARARLLEPNVKRDATGAEKSVFVPMLPPDAQIVWGGKAQAGELVVDGERWDDGIVIYLAQSSALGDVSALLGYPLAPAVTETEMTCWSPLPTADGFFTFDGLQFPKLDLADLRPATGRPILYAATLKGRELTDGAIPRRPASDAVAAVQVKDPRAARKFSVVVLGLRPEKHGLVASGSGDRMKAAAFWAATFDQARLCLQPAMDWASEGDTKGWPQAILTGSDLDASAAASYAGGAMLLVTGGALAAAWWALQAMLQRS